LRRYAEEICRLAETDFVVPTHEQIDRNRYDDYCEYAGEPHMSFEEYVAKHGFEEWKDWFFVGNSHGSGTDPCESERK
jgi:hypothetical protein